MLLAARGASAISTSVGLKKNIDAVLADCQKATPLFFAALAAGRAPTNLPDAAAAELFWAALTDLCRHLVRLVLYAVVERYRALKNPAGKKNVSDEELRALLHGIGKETWLAPRKRDRDDDTPRR